MEKKRSFLGFLASLFMAIFVVGSALANYTCEQSVEYTSCNNGYYLSGGQCVKLPEPTCKYIDVMYNAWETDGDDVCYSDWLALCKDTERDEDDQDCENYATEYCDEFINIFSQADSVDSVYESFGLDCDTTCDDTAYYFDVETGECAPCPDGLNSQPGETGIESCTASCNSFQPYKPQHATNITGTVYGEWDEIAEEPSYTTNDCKIVECEPGYAPDELGKNCIELEYTVTYDLNGATGTKPSAHVCAAGIECVLSTGNTTAFIRDGYVFSGWSTDKNATTGLTSTTLSSDVTMYAIWTKCMVGTYKKPGSTAQSTCITADPGYYVDTDGATEQKPCPIGKYSDTDGATSCTACVTPTMDGVTLDSFEWDMNDLYSCLSDCDSWEEEQEYCRSSCYESVNNSEEACRFSTTIKTSTATLKDVSCYFNYDYDGYRCGAGDDPRNLTCSEGHGLNPNIEDFDISEWESNFSAGYDAPFDDFVGKMNVDCAACPEGMTQDGTGYECVSIQIPTPTCFYVQAIYSSWENAQGNEDNTTCSDDWSSVCQDYLDTDECINYLNNYCDLIADKFNDMSLEEVYESFGLECDDSADTTCEMGYYLSGTNCDECKNPSDILGEDTSITFQWNNELGTCGFLATEIRSEYDHITLKDVVCAYDNEQNYSCTISSINSFVCDAGYGVSDYRYNELANEYFTNDGSYTTPLSSLFFASPLGLSACSFCTNTSSDNSYSHMSYSDGTSNRCTKCKSISNWDDIVDVNYDGSDIIFCRDDCDTKECREKCSEGYPIDTYEICSFTATARLLNKGDAFYVTNLRCEYNPDIDDYTCSATEDTDAQCPDGQGKNGFDSEQYKDKTWTEILELVPNACGDCQSGTYLDVDMCKQCPAAPYGEEELAEVVGGRSTCNYLYNVDLNDGNGSVKNVNCSYEDVNNTSSDVHCNVTLTEDNIDCGDNIVNTEMIGSEFSDASLDEIKAIENLCIVMPSTVCASGYYYNGTSLQKCPAGSYCPGNESTPLSECVAISCSDATDGEFTLSDAGATDSSACYKTRQVSCKSFYDCDKYKPETFRNCVYKDEMVTEKMYAESGSWQSAHMDCTIDLDDSVNTLCATGNYMQPNYESPERACDGSCDEVYYTADSNGTQASYVSSVTANITAGKAACWRSCKPTCDPDNMTEFDTDTYEIVAEHVNWCPERATCTDVSSFSGAAGRIWYPADYRLCIPKSSWCTFTFTCETGYIPSTDAPVSYGFKRNSGGYDRAKDTPACNPGVYEISFAFNSNDVGTELGSLPAIYQKYTVGWFDSSAATNEISQLTATQLPTRVGYTFAGLYTGENALVANNIQVVDKDGNIVAPNNSFTEDTTLYAYWTPNIYTIKLSDDIAGTDEVIYQKYDNGWYTCAEANDGCKINESPYIPADDGYTFGGYENNDGVMIIGANGELPADNTYNDENTSNRSVTLDAIWTANEYMVTLTGVDPEDEDASIDIHVRHDDAWYETDDFGAKITNVKPDEAEYDSVRYTFNGFVDENGTFMIGSDGNLPDASEIDDNTLDAAGRILWTARWTTNVNQCESGKYYPEGAQHAAEQANCVAPYYCPGEGTLAKGDEGCIESCPNGGYVGVQAEDGSWTYETGKPGTSITQCHKIVEDDSKAFGNGTARWDCYYSEEVGDYVSNCAVVPVTCNAGYYYEPGFGATCNPVTDGWYSAEGELSQTQCDPKEGESIHSKPFADAPEDCYVSCAWKTELPHATVGIAPVEDKAMWNGTAYPTCSYTIQCATGYTSQNGENPQCIPNEYNVIFNTNGNDSGELSTDSIKCTFDSKNCALPGTDVLGKIGYKPVAKWCTKDGKCYAADSIVMENLSANGIDSVELFAQWEPDVFKVELIDTDATNGAASPNPIYLKYATGWYSDASASKPLSNMNSLPERAGYDFAGYYLGDAEIINHEGLLVGEFTVTAGNTTATVAWDQGQRTCNAGYYYPGMGAECLECPANHWCGGTTYTTDSGVEKGKTECMNGGLSDGGATATSITVCHMTMPSYESATKHATGEHTCYHDGMMGYNDCRGEDIVVTRCAAGYWYDKSQTTVDCVEVGDGNYSVAPMEREVCPTLNTLDGYTPTTGGSTTSDDVSDCWSTVLYAPDGGHGTGTQVCQYNTTSYAGTSCKEQFINKCDAGYYKSADDAVVCTITPKGTYSETDWLYYQDCPIYPDVEITSGEGMTNIASCLAVTPHDGGECIAHKTCSYQVASGKYDINCGTIIFESCNPGYYVDTAINPTQGIEVEKNFFGPVDINSDGFAIERKPCPEYNGVQGQTDQAASGSVSRCFAEKVTCDIANGAGEHDRCYYGENGYDNCDGYICTVTECNEGTSLVNNTCVGCEENHVCANGQQLSCSVLTNGEYTMSDYGTEDVNQCYYNCQDLVGDDTYPFATKIDGRVYKSGARTCEIAQCTDGYTLEGGECDICPENHWCNPETENGKPQSCPDEFKYSGEESYSADNCYRFCSDLIGTDRYPHASQINGTEYKSGDNDCVITQCKSGYTLKDGECQKCPANMFCNPETENGKPQSCPSAYPYSDAGADGAEDCYRKCEELAGSAEYPTAVQMSGLDYNNGTNTCVIDTCESGYALSNNTCSNCPAGKYCENGKETACPNAYPYSDAGADGAEDCYRKCEEQVGTGEYPNATQIEGIDLNDGVDKCKVMDCDDGYILDEKNNSCGVCMKNHYCTDSTATPVKCPTAYPNAAPGANSIDDCYLECSGYAVEYGTAEPTNDKAYYGEKCEFSTGTSETGNPCDIVYDDARGVYVCVETSCKYDFEMVNGKCQYCARENAIEYKPNGNCVVALCVSGYHPYGQSCEENIVACDAPNAVAAERRWDDRANAYGECIITECEDGYHVAANACQLNIEVCELPHGVGERIWNTSTNKWGDCIATKCDPGYTNDPTQTGEQWQQCGRCNNMYAAYGTEIAVSSYVEECEIASCMYEGEKYVLEGNECVLKCTEKVDETGHRYWDESRKKCVHECNYDRGYINW